MSNNHTEVKVIDRRECSFCDQTALYDGKTVIGPWADMCQDHFDQHGIGLGLGKGQKYIYS